MNFNELITQHNKPLFSGIKANQVLYSLHHQDENKKQIGKSMSALSRLCESLNDYLIDKKYNPELRFFTRSPEIDETEYFTFSPHLNIGYSPFMIFRKNKSPTGVFVKIQQHQFSWCKKTMNKLAKKYYEECFKKDAPVSMKEAKSYVRERVDQKNPDKVPLIEKIFPVTFYIDLANHRLLAKSGLRDQDAIASFFTLLEGLSKEIDKLDDSPALEKDINTAFENRIFSAPYTNFAMNSGVAFGAYSIENVVNYYSFSEQKTPDEPLPVEPTWSGSFCSQEDNGQVITFKNSIGLFFDENKESKSSHTLTSFTRLKEFAEDKGLTFRKIKISGELPTGRLLEAYKKAYPENVEQEIAGDFISVNFNTQSKLGNICMQITDKLSWHKEAATRMMKDHFIDNHCSQKDVEIVILRWQSSVLEVLHDAIDLFATVYEQSAPREELEDEENKFDKSLKTA